MFSCGIPKARKTCKILAGIESIAELAMPFYRTKRQTAKIRRAKPEAEFLDVIGTKDFSFLLFTVTSTNGPSPLSKTGLNWFMM
jgi:hypothetical protein